MSKPLLSCLGPCVFVMRRMSEVIGAALSRLSVLWEARKSVFASRVTPRYNTFSSVLISVVSTSIGIPVGIFFLVSVPSCEVPLLYLVRSSTGSGVSSSYSVSVMPIQGYVRSSLSASRQRTRPAIHF